MFYIKTTEIAISGWGVWGDSKVNVAKASGAIFLPGGQRFKVTIKD